MLCYYFFIFIDQCADELIQMNEEDDQYFITTPNYPSLYDNDLSCIWRFTTNNSSGIIFIIRIFQFDLETGYDLLRVGSGSEIDPASVVAVLSSDSFPNKIAIDDTDMWMLFTSDYALAKSGLFLAVETTSLKEKGKI